MAVPGDVDEELSAGPISLLREGARVVASAADVLAPLGLAPAGQAGQAELPVVGLDQAERALLAALAAAPRHADQLAATHRH